jgi:hypothetical protein
MECSVCFSQRMPCGPKHPIQQVLNHVEVPSSRLSFSSCCFLDPPYFKVQCMRWLSITSALPSSSAQLSRSQMPRMFKFFGGLCGQPFPKYNVRIYCGHISNWPFSWELYHHFMHITYDSMVNIMVALQGQTLLVSN